MKRISSILCIYLTLVASLAAGGWPALSPEIAARVADFEAGRIPARDLPALAGKVFQQGNGDRPTATRIARAFLDDWNRRQPDGLPPANDIFILQNFLRTDDAIFRRLHDQPAEGDKVLGEGRARRVTDYVITRQEFYEKFWRDTEPHKRERLIETVDWPAMTADIATKYGDETARRILPNARTQWFSFIEDYTSLAKDFAAQMADGIKNRDFDSCRTINGTIWDIFYQHVDDRELLTQALSWQEIVVQAFPEMGEFVDTYAHLLLKLGRPAEGLAWEQRAIKAEHDRARRNGRKPRDEFLKEFAAMQAKLPGVAPATLLESKPPKGMTTPWTEKVGEVPLPEYPRPQLVRATWTNLNGSWDYAIRPRTEEAPPKEYAGKILVPFAIESRLSGVDALPGIDERLWYRRTFTVSPNTRDSRTMLHLDGVNWQTEVWLNGKLLGKHEGGFDPFTLDLSPYLTGTGPQELAIAVWNPVDTGAQPRGKQVLNPQAIFYTSVTGIWQTVWLESVPASHIQGLQIQPNYDSGSVSISLKLSGPRKNASAEVRILAAGKEVAKAEATKFDSLIDYSTPFEIKLPSVHAWSPSDPFLYDVEITYKAGGTEDRVKSYFGMRKIERKMASDGYERLFLNNQPIFMYGPLDQGWWPDGLYTAPTDEALRWDIETMKKMGFNMVRKHVKVEPARWYYHCDKLGLLVWQDMPSGTKSNVASHVPPRQQPLDGVFNPTDAAQFRRELEAMIACRRFFPSIVAWVPFNECWGQHDTNETLASVKQLDPTRLVDGPSGWNDLGMGDMIDMHDYPGPHMHPTRAGRASVLGEFGGLGLPVKDHLWQQNANWGYKDYGSAEEFGKQYQDLLAQLRPLIDRGLAAAVYTELTDVETEVNGFITYDRKLIKIPPADLLRWHQALINSSPPPK